MKKSPKIFGISLIGILLLLGLTSTASGQTAYDLKVSATSDWDIGSDNSNNLYIMWCSGHNIYFGKIVNHAVSGQQTVATDANTDKYGWPRLSVQPNGQSMSIVYRTTSSKLNHAWRNSSGTWAVETIPAGTTTNGYWSVAGAVSGDGTMHAAFVVAGVLYYTYKKPGSSWVPRISIDPVGKGGTHMVVDSNGGIHMNWMPYTNYLRYRYAAVGHTLDESVTIKVSSNVNVIVGSGDVYGTPNGTAHMLIGHDRALYHTFNKTINGSFSAPTCASIQPYITTNDHHCAVGADGSGRVYVSWGEQYSDGTNFVKLSVLEDGVWTAYTVDPESNITTSCKPGIAINNQAGYLLWRHKDNHLYLGEYIFNSMKVTAPNGGESMSPDSSQEISWTYGELTGNVKLELLKGEAVLGTIVNNLGITSSPYIWTVGHYLDASGAPQTAPLAGDYRIKISTTDNTYSDTSDAYFALANPSLSLTAPNGGESWVVGSSQTITWTSTGTINNVQIEYSINEGTDWTEVIASTPNDGSHSWTIPDILSSQCLVRITDVADMYVSDVSNAVFTITASLVPSITLTAPASGAQWQRGLIYAITWTKNATQNAYVKINLYKGTGTLVKILVSKTENDGSFNWLVPASVAAGSTYFIRIQTIDGLVRGYSGTFSIIVPSITVTAPTSGMIWAKSGTRTITWNKIGIQNENVKIQLRKGTKLISTLAMTTPNDGSFDWTIPTTLVPSNRYKIRIITVDGLVRGQSTLFTITN